MASPLIVTLTQDNFETEALKSTVPVLVDFWAEWCGPCKMIAPVLDELATEYQGKVKIGKVNIDEHQGLAAQFRRPRDSRRCSSSKTARSPSRWSAPKANAI